MKQFIYDRFPEKFDHERRGIIWKKFITHKLWPKKKYNI